MEPEKLKLMVNGVEYARIEDVPERFRALIRAQIEAAKAAADAPAGSPSKVVKHYSIKINVKKAGGAVSLSSDYPGAPAEGSGSPAPRTLLFAAAVAGLLIVLLLRLRHG